MGGTHPDIEVSTIKMLSALRLELTSSEVTARAQQCYKIHYKCINVQNIQHLGIQFYIYNIDLVLYTRFAVKVKTVCA